MAQDKFHAFSSCSTPVLTGAAWIPPHTSSCRLQSVMNIFQNLLWVSPSFSLDNNARNAYSRNETCALKSPFCPPCPRWGLCQTSSTSTRMFLLQIFFRSSSGFYKRLIGFKFIINVIQKKNPHLCNNMKPAELLLSWLIWVSRGPGDHPSSLKPSSGAPSHLTMELCSDYLSCPE